MVVVPQPADGVEHRTLLALSSTTFSAHAVAHFAGSGCESFFLLFRELLGASADAGLWIHYS